MKGFWHDLAQWLKKNKERVNDAAEDEDIKELQKHGRVFAENWIKTTDNMFGFESHPIEDNPTQRKPIKKQKAKKKEQAQTQGEDSLSDTLGRIGLG